MSGPSSSNVYDVPMTNTPQITLERPTIHDPPETKFRYAQTLYEQSVWNEKAFRIILTSKSDLEEQVWLLTQQNQELMDRFCQESMSSMSQMGRITGCGQIRLTGRSHTVGSVRNRGRAGRII